VLSQSDWPTKVPSLTQAFPTISFNIGNWKLGKEFLRMDGQTSACSRFERITQFSEESVKLFLISSRAGGIGINLCSANRVILFDSNFNPTIDMQALYRCYRYGQTRNVFCYRFLTEGTIEQKVYSRAVNKSSLALSLVDGKTFQRVFSSKETADLSNNDDWV
jgi:SNF2 family DNA or RNA helicase